MDTLLEPIIKSSKLNLYLKELTEFHKNEHLRRKNFYDSITEDKKMEFINGQVIMHSPVKIEHETASSLLFTLLRIYVDKYDLGHVAHEKALICLTRNDYEPDICFFNKEKSSKFKKSQMKFPAPDFVVEVISPSTEDIDRNVKMVDYADHGIPEYWIVDPDQKTVEQYLLKKNKYELAVKLKSGSIQSQLIKGFEIPVKAIFDKKQNLEVLKEILK